MGKEDWSCTNSQAKQYDYYPLTNVKILNYWIKIFNQKPA